MKALASIYHYKLRAHTLFLAVVISFLIGLVCSAFIFSAYLKRQVISQNLLAEKLIDNSQSGIHFLTANTELGREPELLDLFDEGSDSVRLQREYWGIYELLTSTALHGNQSFTKTVLVGNQAEGVYESALYLQDLRRPLSLTGNTLIKGRALLPQAGVKRAYIQGQGFVGSKLIHGSIGRSQTSLPQMEERHIQTLKSLFNQSAEATEGRIDTSHSFQLPTLALQTSSSKLGNTKIHGRVILYSNQDLVIPSSADLKDVIVVAPKILIRSGFKGNMQCFAKDSLLVESNVKLEYPSALTVLAENNQARLAIGSNSEIKGTVLLLAQQGANSDKPSIIEVSKNAEIIGTVFCQGLMIHGGKVYGHVTTSKFFLKTRTSIYENYLSNVTIDFTKLPKGYSNGAMFFEREKKQRVAKWVF